MCRSGHGEDGMTAPSVDICSGLALGMEEDSQFVLIIVFVVVFGAVLLRRLKKKRILKRCPSNSF